MRTPESVLAVAVACAIACLAPIARAADGEVVVRKWLVVEAVDRTGRRPLRPDAVFARHLLDRAAPPPKESETIRGELGETRKWTAREAAEDGSLGGGVAWAYAAVEWPADQVVLAKLERGGVVYVNGTPAVGDIYGYGFGGIPVALRKGVNHVFVAGARGDLRLTLAPPSAPFGAQTWDSTLPHVVEGRPEELWGALLLVNASQDWHEGVPPLGVEKAPLQIPAAPGWFKSPPSEPRFALGGRDTDTTVRLELAKPGEPHRRTFRSSIDGSVQYYALREPADSDEERPLRGLVLTLHGASVEAIGLVPCYAPKPDFWIVAPTNRRPFGFDWQDWGRLDAYEVLADALALSAVDSRRVYLTGHSMGGHGTWHLAANDPDRFLAIAPSAGWSSFDSYGGGFRSTPLAALWRGADGASQTLDLVQNLVGIPTYVLHGTADDNVPVAEAHRMIEAITRAGGQPASQFQEAAGHWWDGEASPGVDCVDWPAIFELFRRTQPAAAPTEIDWTTADPVVDSEHHWVAVQQPIEYGRPVRVRGILDLEAGLARVSTENAHRLTLRLPTEASVHIVELDGAWMASTEAKDAWEFVRENGAWHAAAPLRASEKRPDRSGPFKRVFGNRFLLVVGTAGDDVEDRELLDRARYDALGWWYRANGRAEMVTDTDFLRDGHAGRNVVLYGNADTNAAWDAVFAPECPVRPSRGAVKVREKTFESDGLCCVFLQPRRGDDNALAGAIADTGPAGTRLGYTLNLFGTGAGIPDYLVFGPESLREADGGVRAAGWFGRDWSLR